MRWWVAASLSLAIAGCMSVKPVRSSMHDNFVACIKLDGTEYDVEVEDGTCAGGDVALRCQLQDSNIVRTRTIDDCKRRGGRVLGLPVN